MARKHTDSDRERVLMAIAVETAGTIHDEMKRLAGGWQLRFIFDRPAPQFIPTEMADWIKMPLIPGDIVRCKTNPHHAWGISELVEKKGYADFLLKQIGSAKTCNMGNEMIDVLRFMPPQLLYTGKKRQLWVWASRHAFSERFNPKAAYLKRCGGVDFVGNDMIIWCRPHIWARDKSAENGPKLYAQPKKFTLQWSEATRLKDIVEAMNTQGFGDDFEYLETESSEGQHGYAKFTREDLERIIGRIVTP